MNEAESAEVGQVDGAEQARTVDVADVTDAGTAPETEVGDQTEHAAVGALADEDQADGADGADADEDAGEGDDAGEGAPRRGNRVRLLEKEGEVAADFLERLLDIADLDGDIEVDIDGDRAAVAIVDSEDGRVPRRLVGADGKVLDALQELTRLAVQAETGERSRLMLDVAGHRAQRRVQLVEVARTAIAEVKTTGQRKALDDMSAFERKIVHDEVAAAGLDSESEGVEPRRHIVVFPA
ncbi:MAG: R3H domain-containing nucleic acid-binding protein [Lapillicoccus sp.]